MNAVWPPATQMPGAPVVLPPESVDGAVRHPEFSLHVRLPVIDPFPYANDATQHLLQQMAMHQWQQRQVEEQALRQIEQEEAAERARQKANKLAPYAVGAQRVFKLPGRSRSQQPSLRPASTNPSPSLPNITPTKASGHASIHPSGVVTAPVTPEPLQYDSAGAESEEDHGEQTVEDAETSFETDGAVLKKLRPENCKPLRREDMVALATIVDRPPAFHGQINVDTAYMDLRWVKKIQRDGFHLTRAPGQCNLTLFTMDENALSEEEKNENLLILNSPRSILTCLRNGVQVEWLQFRSRKVVVAEGRLEGLPEYVCEKRYQYSEAKRRSLLHELREQYLFLRATVQRDQIFSWFARYFSTGGHANSEALPLPAEIDPSQSENSGSGDEKSPSSRQLGVARISSRSNATTVLSDVHLSLLEERRKKLEKSAAMVVGVRGRYVERQGHKEIVETEKEKIEDQKHREWLEEKRKQTIELAKQSAVKAEERKRQAEEHARARREQLELRVKEREQKEKERLDAMEEQRKQRRKESEEAALERRKRVLQNRRRQQRQDRRRTESILERQRWLEARLEFFSQLKERETKQMQQRAQDMEVHRSQIHQQAAEMVERKRKEGEEQQQRVENRVSEFMAHKHDEAKLRLHETGKREVRRQAVLETAKRQEEEAREALLRRQEEHETFCRQLNDARTVQTQLQKEEARLKQEDRLRFLAKEQNLREYSKLAVIDNIQRKVEKIDLTTMAKQEIVRETKLYSNKLGRDRDKQVQEIEQEFAVQQKRVFFAGHNQLPLPPPLVLTHHELYIPPADTEARAPSPVNVSPSLVHAVTGLPPGSPASTLLSRGPSVLTPISGKRGQRSKPEPASMDQEPSNGLQR